MSNFRTLLKLLGPNWLVRDKVTTPAGTTETDSRILWPIALYFDACRDRIHAGIKARFPGGGSTPDSLSYLGRDRQIVRGPAESGDTYAVRLSRAFDDWATAGNAWPMLEQLRAYCAPHAVKVALVNNHGRWRCIERDGTRTRDNSSSWNWGGTGWSRFWVLIYMTLDTPQRPWARGTKWGDGARWGAGRTWGSTASVDDVQAIRRIVSTWKHGGSTCVNIMICFDETLVPSAAAPPLPDGTWLNASKNVAGTQVPARHASAIYWRGTS